MLIKPGITADGFRTAVRDYTEPTVVEELAANSYDADASTLLVLLDTEQGHLHIIDDGIGFKEENLSSITILGAGDKREIPYSKGRRHYLGSYGYCIKSTLNIANKVEIDSHSGKEHFQATINWGQLDEALGKHFEGFPSKVSNTTKKTNGTKIKLYLKNPTTKTHLDKFGNVLANLPSDEGKYCCYYGLYREVINKLPNGPKLFEKMRTIANRLGRKNLLQKAGTSLLSELNVCSLQEFNDKQDKSVKVKTYFTGLYNEKVKPLKPGLRGIYVRIHGRLLKQSFTDSKFTYNISKWKKFESGLRVEFSIDWLRDQISLSRTGVRFSNDKLEQDFKAILTRCISAFIQPQLKTIEKKRAKVADKKSRQRFELAKKRVSSQRGITIPGLKSGFVFKPETDGELALIVSQPSIIKKILKNHKLIDYNDQAPFDCILYNEERREYVQTELEPNLLAFLDHNQTEAVELIITWSRAQWRIGAKKKAKKEILSLVADDAKRQGWYKLLEFSSTKSKKPRKGYPVIVIEELFKDNS